MVERCDILGQLPIEISQQILMRVSPENLAKVSQCCKRWRNISRGSYFWKKKSEQDYNFAGSEFVDSEYYRKYVQTFSNHWQGHYTYNRELEYNWKRGLCKKSSVDFLSDFQRFVYMDDDILIVAKMNEICIINISTGSIEKTFQAKHMLRAVVEETQGLLIALCNVTTLNYIHSLMIKVWDLRTTETMPNFEHRLILNFSRFAVYKHLVAFISHENDELSVFNIRTGGFDYQRPRILSMCFGRDTIAMVTGFNLIEIIDMNFNMVMELTCCHDKIIDKIEIKNNYLIVESFRGAALHGIPAIQFICVWDLTANTKLYTIVDGEFADLTFINESKIICLKRHFSRTWLVSLSLPHFDNQEIGRGTSSYSIYTSNNRFLFTAIRETSPSLQMWCARSQKPIRSFDFKGFIFSSLYYNCSYGQIDNLMVSNKNMAYVEDILGKSIVHIMDFGPDIKIK